MEVSGQPHAPVALPPKKGVLFRRLNLICCNQTESMEKRTARERETKCLGNIYIDQCFEVLHRIPTVKFLICFMLINATAGCDAILHFLPLFLTKNLITVHYLRTYSVRRCMLVSYWGRSKSREMPLFGPLFSARPSAFNSSASTERIFVKFCIGKCIKNL
jgi:hypothetical protein